MNVPIERDVALKIIERDQKLTNSWSERFIARPSVEK
jgi:hypothetical protein